MTQAVEDGNDRHDVGQPPWRLFVDFLSSRLGGAVLALGTVVVVTRTTPVQTAGEYIAATAFGALLFSLLDLGTGPSLVRRAARGRRDYEIAIFVWARLVMTAIVTIIGAALVPLLFPPGTWQTGFASLLCVVGSAYSLAGPVGQVVGDARPFRRITFMQGGMTLAAVSVVAFGSRDPSALELVLAYTAGPCVGAVVTLIWVRGYSERLDVRSGIRGVQVTFREIAALALATGAGALYPRLDQSMVFRQLGSAPAAYFGLAVRIVTQARLIPSTVQLTVGPIFARAFESDGLLSRDVTAQLRRLTAFGALATSLALCSVADLAILALGGEKYMAALVPLLILSVSMVTTFYNYVVATACIMSRRDRQYLTATVIALVWALALNVFALRELGLQGAALVALSTELVALLLVSRGISARRGGLDLVGYGSVILIAALAAGAKYLAHLSPLWANGAFTIALLAAAAWVGLKAVSALRELEAPSVAVAVSEPSPQ